MRRWFILLAALLLAIMLPYSLKAEESFTDTGATHSIDVGAVDTVPMYVSVSGRIMYGGL